jgi:hypothetical protein
MIQALRSLTSCRLQRINKRRLLNDVFYNGGHRNRSEALINSHFREVGEVQGPPLATRRCESQHSDTQHCGTRPMWPDDWEKWPNFWKKVAKTVTIAKKCQNIFTKAQFEGPRYLQQTTFETLKYQQQTMFWNCLFRWKSKNKSFAKRSQKCHH